MSAEPVWKEDIEQEVEYLTEGARNLAGFYHQAKEQGAPVTLLDELAAVWQGLDASRRRLEALLPCFPIEPRTTR